VADGVTIRPTERERDAEGIWACLEPVIREGETYPLPRDMTRKAAIAYWLSSLHTTFVAEGDTGVLGTYYIRPNNSGGGAHVANCGYITHPGARGRGVARAMCEHSLDTAREMGFRAMQFNFVIASNERAVTLWQHMGFEIVGTLTEAFEHPEKGFVDAYVMYQKLG
jgi:ribosomal protein S18 acetylase RimI-like enzyme